MSKKKPKNITAFEAAVKATPDVATCYQPGLKALGAHSGKIKVADTRKLEGSVDIDTCTSKKYPQANRWDYAVGYNSEAYFVEVHSAFTSEVSTVLKKLQWLKGWLNTEAPELNRIKAKKNAFVWVQSDKFDIPKHMPQYKMAVSNGILPVKNLNLSY